MVTITATKADGTLVTKDVPAHRVDDFVGYFVAYGYTNVTSGAERATTVQATKVAETAKATETVRTGRTRTGKVVHRLSLNSAECGASFRRNRLGNTVQVTGEAVTCEKCLKLG